MQIRRSILPAILLSGIVAAVGIAAEPTVNCKDGTTSRAGRGACSHHGGVVKGEAAEPSTEPGAKPSAPPSGEVTCKDGSISHAGRGACAHHGGVATGGAAPAPSPRASESKPTAGSPSRSTGKTGSTGEHRSADDPTDAIARCKDGKYSHASQHGGACSHHGGVAQFLDGQ